MLFIKELLILALFYYWFVIAVGAEEINSKQCARGSDFVKSEIHEVSIEPCLGGGVCQLYKETNATITVKFTPFDVSSSCKLKSKLAWISKIDFDFGDISSNACDYMKCPLTLNEENVFSASFFVSKMWPTGPYPLKLRIQEKNGKRVFVCQVFKINVAHKAADIQVN